MTHTSLASTTYGFVASFLHSGNEGGDGVRSVIRSFARQVRDFLAQPTLEAIESAPQGPDAVELTRFRRQPRYAATFAAACCLSKSIGLT